MLEVKIHKDPYELKHYLYKTGTIRLNEGFTVVIGRNGCGKTTFCRTLKDFCNKNDIPCYSYDNYHDGGSTAMQVYLGMEDFESLVSTAFHSEGEQIYYNLGMQIKQIGSFIKKYRESKQLVVVLDTLDSGFDVEGISELKHLTGVMIDDCKKHGIELYIVITANNYALIHKSNCIDIKTGEYHYFDNYEAYEKFIMNQYKKDRQAEARRKKKESKDN